MAYLRIQEIDPKGNVVKDWDLSNDLVYNQSWNDAGTSSQDGLYWFKASLYRDDVYLGITHYLPRVFGILSEVKYMSFVFYFFLNQRTLMLSQRLIP